MEVGDDPQMDGTPYRCRDGDLFRPRPAGAPGRNPDPLVGSYTCASAGLLMVATAFLPHPTRLWLSAVLFLGMTMIPVAYSYFIWRESGEG